MIRLALLLILIATPAAAGPVGGAIVAAASAVATFVTSSVLGQLLLSVGLSALSQALQRRNRPRQPGIATEVTTQGGTNPQSFILGRYATAGNEVAPQNTHGNVNGTPRAYLTYVHDLGDVRFTALRRIVVNDDYVQFGALAGESGYTPHPQYGDLMRGSGIVNFGWVKFYDGSQTAADSMLLSRYGSDPDRPWTADMIGRGIPYVITTFRYRRETWNGLPSIRYEVDGIRLYDPRKDSTVGGSGAHRWSSAATWEFTMNPAVMIYNILRGITLPDGRVWGGEAAAEDLPLASWFAAMNVCDESVPLAAGGTEARYRAGFEVRVTDEPADIIEELLKACSGQILESGGVYKMRAGGVGLPVRFFTDDDIIVSDPQTFNPFIPLGETFNAVHASYPEPESLWSATDAPPRYNATYEAQDEGRRLVADLTLPAVFSGTQVQRLMRAWIEEERRQRRHTLTLPPDAAALEPLDAVSWTSARNGYTAKVFEIAGQTDGILTCNQVLLLRERDAGDYAWGTGNEVPVVLPEFGLTPPPSQSVAGFGVTAVAIQDAAGSNRRPGLRFTWSTLDIDDVDGVQFEIRVQATGTLVAQPQTLNFAGGSLVTEAGLVGNTAYEVRGRYIVSNRREVDWTAWVPITTLDVGRVSLADLGTDVALAIAEASKVPAVVSLPSDASFFGPVVFLTTDQKLYRWTGTAWTTAVTSADIVANAITAGKIAAGAVGATAMAANAITAANAAIADAAITTAKIGVAQVDTLRVAGQAITIPVIATRSNQSQSGTGWSGSIEFSISADSASVGQPIVAFLYAAISGNAEVRLLINGALVAEYSATTAASLFGNTQNPCIIGSASAVLGTNTIRSEFRRSPSASGTATLEQSQLFAILAKR